MLLTILIPTFNRKAHLSILLFRISRLPRKELFKVIIADNCSEYNIQDLLQFYSDYMQIDLYKWPHNTGSTEANVARALVTCDIKTEYIWVLGDDDLPIQSTFNYIIEYILTHKEYNIIHIFCEENSRTQLLKPNYRTTSDYFTTLIKHQLFDSILGLTFTSNLILPTSFLYAAYSCSTSYLDKIIAHEHLAKLAPSSATCQPFVGAISRGEALLCSQWGISLHLKNLVIPAFNPIHSINEAIPGTEMEDPGILNIENYIKSWAKNWNFVSSSWKYISYFYPESQCATWFRSMQIHYLAQIVRALCSLPTHNLPKTIEIMTLLAYSRELKLTQSELSFTQLIKLEGIIKNKITKILVTSDSHVFAAPNLTSANRSA